MWALANKTKLGNVYHRAVKDTSTNAHCDHRIQITGRKYDEPQDDGATCQRCLRIAWQMKKRAALSSGKGEA